VVAVFVGGASALVMSFFSSAAFVGFFGFGTLAVLWVWTTYRGYRSARDRDFAEHQAWMIRSFALTYAAPTLRLWLIVLTVVQLPFGLDEAVVAANAYAPVAFLCWLPNIVIAEIIIRRRGLPSLIRTSEENTSGVAATS
jgi:dolichyl-phosphate-mannose--protein O-mannosyl transferase